MTDTMTSQNIDLSSWDTLHINSENFVLKKFNFRCKWSIILLILKEKKK